MGQTPNKTYLVAKREFIKIVSSKAFWLSISILPLFIFIVGYISGASSKALEDKIKENPEDVGSIHIIDQGGILNNYIYESGIFVQSQDAEQAIDKVKNNEIDAAFVFGAELAQTQEIEIYAQDRGIVMQGRFNEVAKNLVKESIISEIPSQDKQALVTANIQAKTTNYKDGVVVDYSIEGYIVPVASVAVYFMIFILIGNFLLSSVAEEKENRMIETILSIIPGRSLIWGKIIGLTCVAFMQIFILSLLSAAAVYILSQSYTLPIDFSKISIDVWQILVALYFIISGFLFMASIMVGLGSAMPTFKEAQQFSPIFIILSICPVYIASDLIAEPSGTLAVVTGFAPFTAPLVMLFRNAVNALAPWELALGMALMAIYTVAGFHIAFKLFQFGSLEFSRKISIKTIFHK